MTGKRANTVLEIRAYIKGRSQLIIKPVDINHEVCDIYEEDQNVLQDDLQVGS